VSSSGRDAVRIAVVQANCVTGDLHANERKLGVMIQTAAGRGCDIVVLPELAACGYALESRDEASALAQAAEGGPTTRSWEKLAREHGIYICGGFAERAGSKIFNSAALYGPAGLVGIYRKAFLWDRERPVFDAGDGTFDTYALEHSRVGMMICYDAWQPEVPRLLKLLGADIILCPAVWTRVAPSDGTMFPPAVHIALANAHVNRCVIASATQCGVDRGHAYLGMSCITQPNGLIGGPAGSVEDVIAADVSLAEIWASHRWTELSHVFGDRRPDVVDISYKQHRIVRHADAIALGETLSGSASAASAKGDTCTT
jgi:N-carbamoylputrescine amidase